MTEHLVKASLPKTLWPLILAMAIVPPTVNAQRNGDTEELFLERAVTFGFKQKEALFCDPEYRPGQKPINRYSTNLVFDVPLPLDDRSFVPLNQDFLSEFISDRPGDTLMVIWSGGRFKAVIKDIGYLNTVCYEGVECRLSPIDSVRHLPSWNDAFIVLRKEKFYSGPIIPYREYIIPDSSFVELKDSLSQELHRSASDYLREKYSRAIDNEPDSARQKKIRSYWEKLESSESYPFSQYAIITYGPDSEVLPDTFFTVSSGSFVGPQAWSALYQTIRVEGHWTAVTLDKAGPGALRSQIDCAFDLNSDGVLEYLVLQYAQAVIFTWLNGHFQSVAISPYRGC